MPSDLPKKRWTMFIVIMPFLFGMLYLALGVAGSEEPVESDTRLVSFKVFFDERVRFPETIRQSTIKMLFGPGFEIAENQAKLSDARAAQKPSPEPVEDCKISAQGGLLTLRVPQDAVTADIAVKLRQLARIKTIVVYVNE